MNQSKAEWRAWARERRTPRLATEVTPAIVGHLGSWRLLRAAPLVLGYAAMDTEVDLDELIAVDRSRWALPRLDGDDIVAAAAIAPLETHRLGFRQPGAEAPHVDPASITIALVPGMAFDRFGVRLGRGGGHYDRLLARLPSGVLRVGVAPSELVVESLPWESHDVTMTHLVTEHGIAEV